MTSPPVNYDDIAPTYNRRFNDGKTEGIGDALANIAGTQTVKRVLEVGCGTGHWLARLHSLAVGLFGLDFSAGMLNQAQQRRMPLHLSRGVASRLPFPAGTFDLVYCVNAIHHFGNAQAFVREGFRLLRPGGTLTIIGMNPHGRRDSWYVYEYFDGVYETDLARFPSWDVVLAWMRDAGFTRPGRHEVARITEEYDGHDVLDNPFLRKNSCSQLTLLSDTAYTRGLQRIKAAIAAAEQAGNTITFLSDIRMEMLLARKPEIP